MAHYDIFRHNLAIKYPALGHALWEPSPGGRYTAVAVGDVGFIRDGRFHRLFNVLLSPNDPSHRIFGIPEEDEQLRPHVEDHIITGTLSPNHFCSAGVALVSESGFQANEPKRSTDKSTEVSFSCRKQGAVLSLPIQARCQDTVALGDFRKWMINHIDRWFAWARELGVGINRMEDIVLVTGAHLSRSWTNVAFLEDQTDAWVSFEFQVAADTSIDWNVPPDRIIGAFLNRGPIGKDLPEDQCIFIRGFRVTRKLMILRRTLKAAAAPNPDPKDDDSDPEMELISLSTVPEYQDHLHILLEYIAESTPGCDMVLVHDDDLARLDGFGDNTSLDTLQPDAVAAHLRCSKPEISELLFHQGRLGEDGNMEDLSSNSRDANADIETVKVAMLSGSHTLEGRPPLPSSTSSKPVAHTALLPSPTSSQPIARTAPPSSPTSSRPFTGTFAFGNPTTSRLGQHEGPRSTDLLVDGFIARTFTSEDASNYLILLLKTQHFFQHYGIIYRLGQVLGAWYITQDVNSVQGTSPGVPFRTAPLLDYSTGTTHGTVVPQRRWIPAGQVNDRRYVEGAVLQLPIFFVDRRGSIGFPLLDILQGCDRELHNSNDFAPLGGRTSTNIRINWPGYTEWKRQIAVRDATYARNPITVARFMKRVATSVDKFFNECISRGHVATDPRWHIGFGGVTQEDVKVIGVINISTGSWMPIIQLTRYVF